MLRSKLWQAARDYVEAGYTIYPICENSKVPTEGSRGWHDRVETLEQVDAIWSKNPNLNIAYNPGINGFSEVDIDSQTPADIFATLSIPETHTVQTPRGGWHLRYRGGLSTKQGSPVDHVDTIGQKGGVILPPSVVNGVEYVVINDRDPVDIPRAFADKVVAHDSRHTAATRELDLAVNISRARDYLNSAVSRGSVAVAGRNGNNTTRQVASDLFDLGLSYTTVVQLMREQWNPHCQPPWELDWLEFFIGNGLKYRQNEVGCRAATGTAAEVFGAIPDIEQESAGGKNNGEPFLITIEDLMKFADPEELVEDLLIAGENVCLFGEPKKGKSTIALDIALSIAARVPVFGKLNPAKFGCVVYLSGEGHQGMKKRIRAWMQERGVSHRIPFFYKVGVPLVGVDIDATIAECVKYVEGIKKTVQGQVPVLVVIDTMSRSLMGLDEDVANVTRYMDMTEGMRAALNCTVLTLAHSGKDVDRGIRGSNASAGMFDAVWSVEMNDRKIMKLESKWLKDSQDLGPFYFRLRPVTVDGIKGKLNKAVVLQLVPQDEWSRKDDGSAGIFTPEVVRAALGQMSAGNPDTAQPTLNLAEVLAPIVKGEDESEYRNRLAETRKKLTRLSKTTLAAFAFKREDNAVYWCLWPSRDK